MRTIYFLIIIFSVNCLYGQEIKSFDYCYSRDGGIYVYSPVNKKTELEIKQTDPYLSPDGTKLAYTVNSANGDRQIEVMDLFTKQKTLLNTNNKDCYGPVWSPDGKFIVYNAFINNIWQICLIDKDNHDPVIITKSQDISTECFSPNWSADSKKIFAQNMDSIFVFSKGADLIEKMPIAPMTDKDNISSLSKFLFTKDESKIVFDGSVDEPGFNEPPGAIFIFNRKTKTTKRLTPKGYWCSQPFLKGDKIYFTASKADSKFDNIFSIKIDGSNMKLLIRNGSDFTSKIK